MTNTVLKNNAPTITSTFNQRVNFLIESRGVSKQWLAKNLGVSKQALNYLINHATKPKYINELAELLQANPVWIASGKDSPFLKSLAPLSHFVRLPIHSAQSLLSSINHQGNSSEPSQSIEYATTHPEQFIAYQINNDSLFPPFLEKTIFIFDKQKTPETNDYILIVSLENQAVLVQPRTEKIDTCFKCIGVLTEARYIP